MPLDPKKPQMKKEPSYGDELAIEEIQQHARALAAVIRRYAQPCDEALQAVEAAAQKAVQAVMTEKA